MMYQVALFLHIVGVLGIFIALALEFVSLQGLRHTQTMDGYRQWQELQSMVRRVGAISMVVVLLAGFYMMATAWGFVAWVVVTLGTLLLFPPLGAISGIRLAMIDRVLGAEDGTRGTDASGSHNTLLPVSIRERLQHPLLLTSIQVRAAITLGIVFLMTVKPGFAGSLVTIGTAIVLGLAVSLPAWRRERAMRTVA